MLQHRVPRTALPIHFFRHFCCRMYHSASTKAITEPPKSLRLVGLQPWQRGHWTRLSKCVIFGCSILQRHRTSYAVRSAFLEIAILFEYVAEKFSNSCNSVFKETLYIHIYLYKIVVSCCQSSRKMVDQ